MRSDDQGASRSEQVRRVADEALKSLTAELNAGRSDGLKKYLATLSRFRHYSWGNVLLISAQRPTATRVAGYHTWRELGRWVKQGEKGIMIYAPILTHPAESARGAQEGTERVAAESARPAAGFRAAYVFDVEQTDGRALPATSQITGDPDSHRDKLKAIVKARDVALEYDPSIAPAQGVSMGGRIRLIPGLSAAEEFSTLAHELAHEMLHHGTDRARLPTVVRETQAEAVAYVVSHAIGLETNRAASDYIALYNGDAKTLADSLNAIQETASRILQDLLPEERLPRSPSRTMDAAHRDESTSAPDRGEEGPSLPEPDRSGPDVSDSFSMDR